MSVKITGSPRRRDLGNYPESYLSAPRRWLTLIILMTIILGTRVNAVGLEAIKIYGYMDLEAEGSNHSSEDGIWTFDLHRLNMITTFRPQSRLLVFSEIEWEHGPNIGEDKVYGAVELVNAFIELKKSDLIKVRFGLFVAPFGIYNERHDATPTFLPVTLPHSIYGKIRYPSGNMGRLFSKWTTGIQVFGTAFLNDIEATYQLYLGNGRGKAPNSEDDNTNKGYGGHLQLRSWNQEQAVGISFYSDRNGQEGNARQHAGAIDLTLQLAKFQIESEIIAYRLETSDASGVLTGNYLKGHGSYLMLSHPINSFLTPFCRLEHTSRHVNGDKQKGNLLVAGLNWKAMPSLYVKTEMQFHRFPAGYDEDYERFMAAIAVAF